MCILPEKVGIIMNEEGQAYLVKRIQHLPPTIHKIILVDFWMYIYEGKMRDNLRSLKYPHPMAVKLKFGQRIVLHQAHSVSMLVRVE